jgi:hypothetical protein
LERHDDGGLLRERNLSGEYRARLYPVCDRLRQTALEIISQGDLKVTEHGMLHPNILAATLLSRTLSNFKALILVTKAGMAVEARVMARCCFENLFLVGALHAEGLSFVDRMRDDDKAGKKGRIRFAFENDLIFYSLSAEMKEAVKNRHEDYKAGPKIGFLNPKEASAMSEFKETYVAYSQFSGDAAHPTITALARHWMPGPTGKVSCFEVEPQAKEEELDETLHLSCIALMGMLVAVNEIVGLTDAGKKLPGLNHELKLLQAERWGPGTINEGREIRTQK